MPSERTIMGLFSNAGQTVAAIKAIGQSPWSLKEVHGPVPDHHIAEALQQKKSRVGYYTLFGGIIGFFSGFALAAFTSLRWGLIVSGKPVVALVPFFIVGFEFTVLFSVFGNVVGLLTEARLPDYKGLRQHDPRCTGDQFGVVAAGPEDQQTELEAFLREQGAQIAVLPAPD